MRKPNFFIIGAPKCGTTALNEYLRAHPQVFVSTPKEPHYFAHDFPHYKQRIPTIEDYLAIFESAHPTQTAIGEASVWYLYSKVAANEIYQFAPDARVIVMLRNPVDVVESIHSQLVWVMDEDVKSLRDAWELQEKRRNGVAIPRRCREPAFLQYADTARLGLQLARVMDVFPRRQVKVIFLEDMRDDPRKTYTEVLDFIGVADDGRKTFPRINENKYNKSEGIAYFLQRPPRVLARVVKSTFGSTGYELRKRMLSINSEVKQRPKMDPELRRELIDLFREDVTRLELLTERDLSHWLAKPET